MPLRAHVVEPGRVALHSVYLQDYFEGRSGSVTVSLAGGASGPVLFACEGRPNALIMFLELRPGVHRRNQGLPQDSLHNENRLLPGNHHRYSYSCISHICLSAY